MHDVEGVNIEGFLGEIKKLACICTVILPSNCMDGREGMTFQGPAAYYLNRVGIGVSGGGSGAGHNVHGAGGVPIFKTHSNTIIPVQPNVGSVSGSPFHVENQSHNFSHGMSMTAAPSVSSGGETVKKKRGRPRKYGPDKSNMSLALSPMSETTPYSEEINPEKKKRGRPPGTGWKQQLAPLGEWMNSTAGLAFTPHVIHIGVGEDIAAKILAFAQQRPRALCILSANGSVSTVTIRQPTTSTGTMTYEGHFEILCLSGSYLLNESAGPCNRTGGISISVCNPDGRMIGGAIGGRLIAANPVQVVACSFIYGSTKGKDKPESETKDEKYMLKQPAEKSSVIPGTWAPSHSTPGASVWPLDSHTDAKNPHPGFDLMRG